MAKELDIEKVIKKATQEFSKETKQHVDAMFEEFEHRVKTIGEPYVNLNKNFDKIDKRFDEIQNTLDMQSKLLQAHGKTLKSHTETLGLLYVDVSEMKSSVKDMPFQIKFLRDFKLDKKHFVDMDQRIRRLEKK